MKNKFFSRMAIIIALAAVCILVGLLPSTDTFAKEKKSITVKSQSELNEALQSGRYSTITVKNSKLKAITVSESEYKNVTLSIKSSKVTFDNSAVFKKIKVSKAAAIIENARGNSYSISDKKLDITVSESAEVKAFMFTAKTGEISIVNNGTIKKVGSKDNSELKISMAEETGENESKIETGDNSSDKTSLIPVDKKETNYRTSEETTDLEQENGIILIPENRQYDLSLTAGSYDELKEMVDKYGWEETKVKITLTKSVTVPKGKNFVISKFIALVVPEKYKLTLSNCCCYIDGELITGSDNFDLNAGGICITDNAGIWRCGDIVYSMRNANSDNMRSGNRECYCYIQNYSSHLVSDTAKNVGFKLCAYAQGDGAINIYLPKGKSMNDIDIAFRNSEVVPIYVNGSLQEADGNGTLHNSSKVVSAEWRTSKSCTVSSSDTLGAAVGYYSAHDGGSVTVANDIIVKAHLSIRKNTKLVVPNGRKLKLTTYNANINGVLVTDANGVASADGYEACFNLLNAGTWHKGDFTITVRSHEFHAADIFVEMGSLEVVCKKGTYIATNDKDLDVYVSVPSGKTIDDLNVTFNLKGNSNLYVNNVLYSGYDDSQKEYVSFAEEIPMLVGSNESDCFYDTLNKEEAKLYDFVQDFLDDYLTTERDYSEQVDYRYPYTTYSFDSSQIASLSREQIALVMSQVDVSKYFFVADVEICPYCNDINFIFYQDFADGKSRHKTALKLEKKLEEVVAEIEKSCTSDYDRIKYIHDYICKSTKYDYDLAYYGFDSTNIGHGIYSVLTGNPAICIGYARAFRILAGATGIESVVACGCGHAWNKVKLDGNWYNVDCTWDDFDVEGYTYLEPSTDFFLYDDNAVPDYYPSMYYDNTRITNYPKCLSYYTVD